MTERFTGFSKSGLTFLTELAATQNREWFEANRSTYERELRLPMQALVGALAFPFQVHDVELACDPKRALFRIHRDIRFSKNKDPYKTHVGASMTKSGERLAPGLLYIHIDPKGSFLAGGAYMPEPKMLQRLRRRIADRDEMFLKIVEDLDVAGLAFDREASAKRTPGGFEDVDNPDLIDFIKLKSFTLQRPLDEAVIADGDKVIDAIVLFARQIHPMLKFIWAA